MRKSAMAAKVTDTAAIADFMVVRPLFEISTVVLEIAAVEAGFGGDCREALARMEKPRLHGVLRDRKDVRGLFHRLLVVVDEVDDLAMLHRELVEAAAQDLAAVLLLGGDFRIVAVVLDRFDHFLVELILSAAPTGGERLVAGHRQHPGRDRGAALEL